MEERKIRVAITHGDTNGIGYEVIFKAFEDQTMFDLCTPIIYGSPKVAAYHRKALSLEVQYSIIDKATDARDGRLNLLTTFDEEVKVEFGSPSEESDAAARKAVAKAKEDLQKGLYDVLVQAPMRSVANPGRCDIYTSCEPCPMCLGAIYWAHLDRIFYANDRKDAGAIGFDDDFIYEEMEKPFSERRTPLIPLLRDEGIHVFRLWSEKEDKTEY